MAEETIFDLKRRLFRKKHGDPKGPWERFHEFLVVDQSTTLPAGPNWEARALFGMIQYAFDGSGRGKSVKISPYLIHNLAACCCVGLEYDQGQRIPWDTNEHDDILGRTYTGFTNTVIGAIQRGETREIEGKVRFGHLPIPMWFVAWARDQAARQDPA